MANEIAHKTAQQGEIILYQLDETVRLDRLRVGGLCPGMNTSIKNVKGEGKLPLGKLPLGNILYLCGIKCVN